MLTINAIKVCLLYTSRMGRPEEVGRLALQLAGNHPYLTGQIITLDGAWI